jgi:hypothetical protein
MKDNRGSGLNPNARACSANALFSIPCFVLSSLRLFVISVRCENPSYESSFAGWEELPGDYRRTNHHASAHNSGNTTKISRNVVRTDRLSSGQRPTINLNDENQNPNV